MKRMHSIAFRARKADCLDLPEVTDIVTKLSWSRAMKLYSGSEESMQSLPGELTVTNVLTRILRLSQLTEASSVRMIPAERKK